MNTNVKLMHPNDVGSQIVDIVEAAGKLANFQSQVDTNCFVWPVMKLSQKLEKIRLLLIDLAEEIET